MHSPLSRHRAIGLLLLYFTATTTALLTPRNSGRLQDLTQSHPSSQAQQQIRDNAETETISSPQNQVNSTGDGGFFPPHPHERRAFKFPFPSLNNLPCLRGSGSGNQRQTSCASPETSAGQLDLQSENYPGWDLPALSMPPNRVMTGVGGGPYVFDRSQGEGVTVYLWWVFFLGFGSWIWVLVFLKLGLSG